MVGIVIATHGRLGDELVATARQIVGTFDAVATCSVEPGASPESLKSSLCDAVASVESGDGVLVLADLLGGSPCTQSLSLCMERQVEVVTGVNLPMLVKANSLRAQSLPVAQLAQELAAYGQRHITFASEKLRGSRPPAA